VCVRGCASVRLSVCDPQIPGDVLNDKRVRRYLHDNRLSRILDYDFANLTSLRIL
jgi:hypothetical protein